MNDHRVLLLVLALALPPAALAADAPKHSLDALVAQFQQSPEDQELRERVIKAALAQKAPPPIPEEAQRRMTRAQTFKDLAEKKEDFGQVAVELEEALKLAPWWAQAYYNLGLAREKGGEFAAARAAFANFLLSAPASEKVDEVRKRLIRLEVYEEKATAALPPSARKWPDAKPEPFPWPPLDPSADRLVIRGMVSGREMVMETWQVGEEEFEGQKAYATEVRVTYGPSKDDISRTRNYFIETPEGLAQVGSRMAMRMAHGPSATSSDRITVYDPPTLFFPRGFVKGERREARSVIRSRITTRITGPHPHESVSTSESVSTAKSKVTGEEELKVGGETVRCWTVKGTSRSTTDGKTMKVDFNACMAPGIGMVRSEDMRATEMRFSKPAFGMGERLPPKS